MSLHGYGGINFPYCCDLLNSVSPCLPEGKLGNCHHFCRYLGNGAQRKATISNMNVFTQIYN